MIRLVVELLVVVLLVAAALYAARQLDYRPAARSRALDAPPQAVWRAVHAGTDEGQTEVSVVLTDPATRDVFDRRTCAVIDNQDPAYDKLLYNAVEDARSRADLLNTLGDG